MSKVVLMGYMGSGKSIIGQLLSEKTGISFIDLDNFIELKETITIKSIFENKGEIYFRKIEHQYFKELLQSDQHFILSTGGGTICYASNHELLNNNEIISIYLNASIDTLYDRLVVEKTKRPIIAEKSEIEMRDFIAKHLFDRNYYYNQAKFKINVNNKSIQEIVIEIEKILA